MNNKDIVKTYLRSSIRASKIGIKFAELAIQTINDVSLLIPYIKSLDPAFAGEADFDAVDRAIKALIPEEFDFNREMAIGSGHLYETTVKRRFQLDNVDFEEQVPSIKQGILGHCDFLVRTEKGKHVVECKSFGNLRPFTKGETEKDKAIAKVNSDSFGYLTQMALYVNSLATTDDSLWYVYSRDSGNEIKVPYSLSAPETKRLTDIAVNRAYVLYELFDLLLEEDSSVAACLDFIRQKSKELGEVITSKSVSPTTGRVYGTTGLHFNTPELFNKGTGKPDKAAIAAKLTKDIETIKSII